MAGGLGFDFGFFVLVEVGMGLYVFVGMGVGVNVLVDDEVGVIVEVGDGVTVRVEVSTGVRDGLGVADSSSAVEVDANNSTGNDGAGLSREPPRFELK